MIPHCPGKILDLERATATPVWKEEGRVPMTTAHATPSWAAIRPSMETAGGREPETQGDQGLTLPLGGPG